MCPWRDRAAGVQGLRVGDEEVVEEMGKGGGGGEVKRSPSEGSSFGARHAAVGEWCVVCMGARGLRDRFLMLGLFL